MTRDGQAARRKARPGKPGPLPLTEVVAAAFRAGRRDIWRVLAVAVAVSLVTAVAEIIVDHYTDPTNALLSASAGISAEAVSLLGTVFLAGFLCRLVGDAQHGVTQHGASQHGASQHGGERRTLWQVARRLPWIRLALADLAVVALTVAGLLALVIPGLVIVNLLAVTGPIVEIEDRGVGPALLRSARLVLLHFWKVALLATVPVLVVGEAESAIPSPEGTGEILGVLAIRGLGEAVVEAAIGLVLVQLCYRLIAIDRARQAPRDSGVTRVSHDQK